MPKKSDAFSSMLAQLADELQAEQPKKEVKPKSEFQKTLQEIKKQAKKEAPRPKVNGAGYEYVRLEDGTYRVRSQVEWEKYHPGRKVAEHQRVIFKDGDKKNFSKENLILAYKSGVSLATLTCRNCGCQGNWEQGDVE